MKKFILFLVVIVGFCFSSARADVIVPCLDCTFEQAETKALFEAR
ncbi:hypothetical protein PSI9734_02065 [Pseudidiomarina piscicola]|uniref:Uncharacterized protein n=1 Tax=Pseudidiomarina piscicola TaxID=2614830 RepID=A0A6S6WLM4_9GAMM|nr:hypothetical protein PSI9734_02065 [Pseudidiomarina piscicola]VZT41155.1 hypothetical protein PSI9734_02065 [Pseudomonas aeruginosa]